MDQHEAGEVLDEYLKEKQLVDACDTILIPALGLAEHDRHRVERHKSRVVCISALLPPAAVGQACYLCKRLRTRFPELQIMVGLWDAQGDQKKANERIQTAGANKTVTTFAQGLEHLRQLGQSLRSVTTTDGDPTTVSL
jgi:hypothetical protein